MAIHLTHLGLRIPRSSHRIVLKSLPSSLHSNKRVHSTPCGMQIIIYNEYTHSFHPLLLTNFTTTRLQWLIYVFIFIPFPSFLYTRAYGSFCHMQGGYCDRFECESIILNIPGRDRVPLGGGWCWWTNSVGGLTRDDECIIPQNVYRLPSSYRPVPSFAEVAQAKVHEHPHAQRIRKYEGACS